MFPVQFRKGKEKKSLRTAWTTALCEERLKRADWVSTDISSTVDQIKDHNPELPLRLSANLLLGVVKVYSKKVVCLFRDYKTLESFLKGVSRQSKEDEGSRKAERSSITLPSPTNFSLDDIDDPFLDLNDVYAHTADPSTITLEDNFFTVQIFNDERFDADLGSNDPSTLSPGRWNLNLNDQQPLLDSPEKLAEEADLNNEQPPPEESVDVDDSNKEQLEMDFFEDPGEGVDLNIEQPQLDLHDHGIANDLVPRSPHEHQGLQHARKRNYDVRQVVLSDRVMVKNLNDTSNLLRTRRDISSLTHKRVLTGDILNQPIFEGMCNQLYQKLFVQKNKVGASIVEEGSIGAPNIADQVGGSTAEEGIEAPNNQVTENLSEVVTGAQNNQGVTGAQNNQGVTGAQNNQGVTGAQNNQVTENLSEVVTGAQNNQGVTGAQNNQGADDSFEENMWGYGHEIDDDNFDDALVDANDVPAHSSMSEKHWLQNDLKFLFMESDSIPAGCKYSMRTRALVKYFERRLPQPQFTLRQSLFNVAAREHVQAAMRMFVELLVALNANLIGVVHTEREPGQFYDVELKLIPPEENGEGGNEGRGNEEEEKGGDDE